MYCKYLGNFHVFCLFEMHVHGQNKVKMHRKHDDSRIIYYYILCKELSLKIYPKCSSIYLRNVHVIHVFESSVNMYRTYICFTK